MKDQLVSRDVAKLAKEKGFKVSNTEDHFFYKEGYKHPVHFEYLRTGYGDDIIAPTQSLLQRWLREMYGVHIVILRLQNRDGIFYQAEVDGKGIGNHNDNTYEQTLDAALIKALKLIK